MENNENPVNPSTPLGRPIGMPLDPQQPDLSVGTAPSSDATEPATQLSQRPSADPKKPSSAKKGSGRKLLIALLIVLLLGGLGAGAYFLFFQKDSKKSHSHDADDDIEMADEDNEEAAAEEEETDDTYAIEEADLAEEDYDAPALPAEPVADEQNVKLSGDADGFPLTLTLHFDGDQVSGTYSDESAGTTMNVSGTRSGDAIHLTGRANNTTYTFRIHPDGHLYTGTLSAANGLSRELHLTQSR